VHRHRARVLVLAISLMGAALAGGCGDEAQDPLAGVERVPGEVTQLRVEVRTTFPHDPRAFTQGLEVLSSGRLLESTGQYGESTIREVELDTGRVVQARDLPSDSFGEGITVVGDRAVQLTWKEGIAYVWDLSTFEQVDTFVYQGQGWGLCHDGDRFVMSDGSSTLTFRDTETFEPVGEVDVRLESRPLAELNELECVGERLFANIWREDRIVEIDPTSGEVTAEIDASGLLSGAERAGADVLNGIAWDTEREAFLLTGKYWPSLFEVAFVPLY
jgi:glutaminyl-peptide cyclotransferase